MNWRKPLIYALLYAGGNGIPRYLGYMRKWERAAKEDLDVLVEDKLRALLYRAWSDIPYYRRILQQCGAVVNGNVDLTRFSEIPVLTKKIIKNESATLHGPKRLVMVFL